MKFKLRQTLRISIVLAISGFVGEAWSSDATPIAPPEDNQPVQLALRLRSSEERGFDNVCDKVKLTAFTPAAFSQETNNTDVAPKSAFSFLASEASHPINLSVTIKGQPVPVTIAQKTTGFLVSGKLPDGLKGTFARINIIIKGPECEQSDGWLLKVGN